MNRQNLIDNLVASRDHRELVTLTLRPVAGERQDGVVVESGTIIAVGQHYTGRRSLQAVLRTERGRVLIIGLTMIKDFQVGEAADRYAPARLVASAACGHEGPDPLCAGGRGLHRIGRGRW